MYSRSLQFRLLSTILIALYNSDCSLQFRSQLINQQLNQLNRLHYYDLRLETALCYQHYFCNTELRTATITKIKGLSIQTQQNTFVLFTLFKLTSDERKTLTKIPTHKTSHNHSPKPAHALDMKEQENQQTTKTKKRRKGSLHKWWRIWALGFHQKIKERRNDHQQEDHNWFCIKILCYFLPTQD